MYLASTHPSSALEIDSLSSSVPLSAISRAFQVARKHAMHGSGLSSCLADTPSYFKIRSEHYIGNLPENWQILNTLEPQESSPSLMHPRAMYRRYCEWSIRVVHGRDSLA